MRCPFCGYETEISGNCQVCGRDLSVYRRIIYAADICYNEGLKRAMVRDLSGACESLQKCLRYNKNHIDARNLLGLVYFEIGEYANALYEWVISKNLRPRDNLADYYLDEMSGNHGIINRIDNITKKYNQALQSAKHGDYDLAMISLKRIVGENPNMIKAKSLLALLCMQSGNYRLAGKELMEAQKIDKGNATIETYIAELKILSAKAKSARGTRRLSEEETLTNEKYTISNYIMDYSKVTIVNIIIGGIIGILASVFLIFPAMRQYSNDDALKAFLTANEDIRSTENEIDSKQEQIDALTEVLEKYEGQADIKTSYENLVKAYESYEQGDYENALPIFDSVTRAILDENGMAMYDKIAAILNPYRLSVIYSNGQKMMEDEDFAGAINMLSFLTEVEETYDNGNALYMLGECYEKNGDEESAIRSYNRVVALFEGWNIAGRANNRLRSLEQ